MRRAIVAIDTIHSALVPGRNLFRREWPSAIVILGYVSLPILDAHPRNDLSMFISGNVRDLVSYVHVPVDALHQTSGGAAAADVYQHSQLTHGVLLIVTIVSDHLQLRAEEFLGPVTLLTRFRRRAQVVHRTVDGLRIFFESYRVKLIRARNL